MTWPENRLPLGPLDVFVYERLPGEWAARFMKHTSKQPDLTYEQAQKVGCEMARRVLEKALAALNEYEEGLGRA